MQRDLRSTMCVELKTYHKPPQGRTQLMGGSSRPMRPSRRAGIIF